MSAAESHPRVLGVGWALLDRLVLLSRYPAEDTKTEALKSLDQAGGPVLRALSVLSRLGFDTQMACVAADDQAGRVLLSQLRSRGVGVGGVQVSSGGATAEAQVWVSDTSGSRTIAYSGAQSPSLQVTDELRRAAQHAQHLHLDGRERDAAETLAAEVKSGGGTVSLDAGGWKHGLEDWLHLVDTLIIPRSTLDRVCGGDRQTAAADMRSTYGMATVVVTDREGDVEVVSTTARTFVPIPRVHAVDTNGAGDAFAGGFIFGLLKWNDPVRAARFAAHVSAILCTHFGDYFPTLDEVESRFRAI